MNQQNKTEEWEEEFDKYIEEYHQECGMDCCVDVNCGGAYPSTREMFKNLLLKSLEKQKEKILKDLLERIGDINTDEMFAEQIKEESESIINNYDKE